MTTSPPTPLSPLISQGLSVHFEKVSRGVHSLLEPLSTDQIWLRPFGYGNSVGHLLLHLTGNLNYYIGARIADTGYVRDRPREFADPARRPKDDVLRDFDAALALVLDTLAAQTDADWGAPIEAKGAEDVKDRFGMFVRCVAHLDHHAGQMIYLCRELTRPPVQN
jgi:uncharacterized damage-inducible protein DinB